VIEERGDFLALMFAIPFVDSETANDYFDRAVSLMTCGTKDADELGDAYAIILSPELSYQWRQIGLVIEGGHVLAKLALSDRQVSAYDTGAAPTELEVFARLLAQGDKSARRSLFALTADPDLKTFDRAAAADHLLDVLSNGDADDEAWALGSFRRADAELRDLIARRIDIGDLFLKAAQRGDVAAKLEFALLLRDTATSLLDLRSSVRWLQEAAEGGSTAAMTELGHALAYGVGAPRDVPAALVWLDQAERAGDERARDLARLLRLGGNG